MLVFTRLMNVVARRCDSLEPWKEIDGAITTLAVLLAQGGLDAALGCIRPEDEGVKDLAGGDEVNNPKSV
jgi:hypothetical protein